MSKGISQAEEWLLSAIKRGHIPHACFISCPDGLIAEGIARRAAALYCTGAADAAMLSHTGNCIIPSGYRKDTIREEVIEELGRSSFSGGKRSVLLLNAHEIDPATQNVLLKTIEEPPDGVLFLLTGNDAGILPTILSRCATVLCGLPMYDDTARELMSIGLTKNDAMRFARMGGTVQRSLKLYQDEDYRSLRGTAQEVMAALLRGELPFDRLNAVASIEGAHFMLSYMRDMLTYRTLGRIDQNADRAEDISSMGAALYNRADKLYHRIVGERHGQAQHQRAGSRHLYETFYRNHRGALINDNCYQCKIQGRKQALLLFPRRA